MTVFFQRRTPLFVRGFDCLSNDSILTSVIITALWWNNRVMFDSRDRRVAKMKKRNRQQKISRQQHVFQKKYEAITCRVVYRTQINRQ